MDIRKAERIMEALEQWVKAKGIYYSHSATPQDHDAAREDLIETIAELELPETNIEVSEDVEDY